MSGLRYDVTLNEDGLQRQILQAVADPEEIATPVALATMFSGLADLRACKVLGRGIFADALGLLRDSKTLALFEFKHPNDWKTGHSALYQVLAYAGHLSRAVDENESECAAALAGAFSSKLSNEEISTALELWRTSRSQASPLGNLSLVCVVPVHAGWHQVLTVLRPYGVRLRVIHASVIVDPRGASRAVGWYEVDPMPVRVERDAALRWSTADTEDFTSHAVARISLPAKSVCFRSSLDLTTRICSDDDSLSPFAVFTPMTCGYVLVEVADRSRTRWTPHLVAHDDTESSREIEKALESTVERTP